MIEEYADTGLIILRNGEDFSKNDAVWKQAVVGKSKFCSEIITENFEGTKLISEKKNALLWRS